MYFDTNESRCLIFVIRTTYLMRFAVHRTEANKGQGALLFSWKVVDNDDDDEEEEEENEGEEEEEEDDDDHDDGDVMVVVMMMMMMMMMMIAMMTHSPQFAFLKKRRLMYRCIRITSAGKEMHAEIVPKASSKRPHLLHFIDMRQCDSPFGMEDGNIDDNQITASSIYNASSQASQARLRLASSNTTVGAWCAARNTVVGKRVY